MYSQAATWQKFSSLRFASPSGRLVLDAEVAAAGLVALEGVEAHELAELEEVGHAAGVLERLVELLRRRRGRVTFFQNSSRRPGIFAERLLEALLVARHAAVLPHDLAELAVEGVDGPLALDREQALRALGDRGLRRARPRGGRRRPASNFSRREVVADGVGDDEVAVGQALHQRGGAEAVGAVVGEVGLAEDEEAGDRAHQVVVHPEPAHRVVHGGVDPHRHLVRVLVGDALVHLEEVAVLLLDRVLAEALDGVLEVEVDAEARRARRRGPRRRRCLAAREAMSRGREVAEARVHALEVVVALVLGDLARRRACRPSPSAPRCGRRCGATRS